MQFDSSFALMLSLFACIPLFIDVSGVVASMRATACPHSVTEYYTSFFWVLLFDLQSINI